MASIGQSITGPRFVETDEVLFQPVPRHSWLTLSQWFDRQKSRLEVLESQLRGLVKAIEVVSKQRNGLSATYLIYVKDINSMPRAGERGGRICTVSQ
jgi:sorting nexin-1/2